MTTDIDNNIKNFSTCLGFQQMQPKGNIISPEIPVKPWKVIGAGQFTINNSSVLHVVVYRIKFPIVKLTNRLSADSLYMCDISCLLNTGYQRKLCQISALILFQRNSVTSANS